MTEAWLSPVSSGAAAHRGPLGDTDPPTLCLLSRGCPGARLLVYNPHLKSLGSFRRRGLNPDASQHVWDHEPV